MNPVARVTATYLVVILTDQLPIVLAIRSPGAVVHIVIQGKVAEARLFVRAAIHCLPGHRCLGGIEVDPDEANFIDVGVDLEETIGILIKVAELIKLGGFGELAIQAKRPA